MNQHGFVLLDIQVMPLDFLPFPSSSQCLFVHKLAFLNDCLLHIYGQKLAPECLPNTAEAGPSGH